MLNKKRVISTLLCVSFVIGVTACASSQESQVSESNTSESSVLDSSAEVTVETVATTEATPTGLDYDSFATIDISSDDLHDGVWDTLITNTLNGDNLSPELSWNAVEGASCYAVYMIDTDAYWLHLKAYVTDSSLAHGQIDGSDDNSYIGPYPPSGTHHYVVYVVALKNNPGRVNLHFDSGNNTISRIMEDLDADEAGNGGNIVGFGELSGTYTCGD